MGVTYYADFYDSYTGRIRYLGGVIQPTNPFTVLPSVLALIGLVATAAVAVKKRRN